MERGCSLSNAINEVSDRAGLEFSSFEFLLVCKRELSDFLFSLTAFLLGFIENLIIIP